jgi:hypothetical protein
MATEFIRIPPDSTGKRIRHTERLDVVIASPTLDLQLISRGDVITGATSGATARFVGTQTEFGVVEVFFASVVGNFIVGEFISTSEYLNFGVLANQELVYTPGVHISDPSTPYNRLKIDDNGSAFTRFAEGDLGFDTFGHAQVTTPNVIGHHTFIYQDIGFEKYGDTQLNDGTVTIETNSSELVLSTSTISGSKAIRQTHQYYPYTPGVGTEILMSVRTGSPGQAGTVRQWGLFDDNDGVFFKVSGSDFLVGSRSSVSGTPVDTLTAQTEWNGERLENITNDLYILDTSKYNLYWIDFAWLGVNRIRFGTYSEDGQRIILHTVLNANTLIAPYARRGTLPLRLEQYNETAVGSPSQLRMVCASIQQQKETEYKGKSFSSFSNVVGVSGSAVPIISIRPREFVGGKDNRITYFASSIEYSVVGGPCLLETYMEPNLIGSTFTSVTASYQTAQSDIDATSFTGGTLREAITITGTDVRHITEDFENSLTNYVDGTAPTITFAAKTIHPGDTANVFILVRWKEVH